MLFRQTDWWLSSSAANQALMLHSRGGLGNATFAMGEAGALDALMSVHPGPRHTFLTCEPHHLETMLRYFDLDQRQTMIRMHDDGELVPADRRAGAPSHRRGRARDQPALPDGGRAFVLLGAADRRLGVLRRRA